MSTEGIASGAPKEASPIEKSVKALCTAANSLKDSIANLANRLSPILVSSPGIGEDSDEPSVPEGCSIVIAIDKEAQSVREFIRYIEDLISRLQI